MSTVKTHIRRKQKVKSKIGSDAWRISLDRTNRCLSAQLIKPHTGEIVLGAVDRKAVLAKVKLTKTDLALEFGKWFAGQIKRKKIGQIALDRGSRRYHGRIKAFAEGLRNDGVKI